MTLEDKRTLVDDNAEVIVSALNTYLDEIYSLIEEKLPEGTEDNVKNFVEELKNDAATYENVRRKILDKSELDLLEINFAAISLMYISRIWENKINVLTKSKSSIDMLFKKLMEA